MKKSTTEHILSNLNIDTKRAICTKCGEVSINKNILNDKWYCARKIYKKSKDNFCDHKLSNINTEKQIADCILCGPVRIYYQRPKNKPHFWTCGRKMWKKLKKEDYTHILSNICEKSETAICKNCGIVGIVKCKTLGYWMCEVNYHCNKNKKQEFHRQMKCDKCDICGFIPQHTCQLDIHHIDHNHNNNDISNLIEYCGNCHRLEHKPFDYESQERQKWLQYKRQNGVNIKYHDFIKLKI